ncbi:Nn.00g092130.m01.CDS01 [Neocucurbitaria sp. VM-36]
MPPTYDPSPAPPPTMTTALPIIPRQVPQRPKLSINTQQTRIIGKGASLRLETLSAVSPTVRNTFSNAYEQPSTAPALERPSKPRLSIDSNISNANSASTPSSASTLSSTLTSASNESATISIPYKQPHNLASILANSPARSIIPRKMAPTRPMFPAEKRVSFRTPLEEEIKTVKYTLAHSDLASSSSTLTSIATTASTDPSDTGAPAVNHSVKPSASSSATSKATALPLKMPSETSSTSLSSLDSSPRPKAPRVGEKRDSSSSEDDSDCPETPVAGRRKRRRDWRWTLGPLPGSTKSASSTSDATTSEDSN